MNPDIFRANDIRGVYGVGFDAEFAQRLGSRVAAHFKAGTLIVGRDSRASSAELAHAVIDGAVHTGARVVDVGEVSSPQFYWAIRHSGAAGGVMVTASHNPGEYNGFKVNGADAGIVGGDQLRQIYDSREYRHHSGGAIERRDVIPEYAAAVAAVARWDGRELPLSVDAPVAVRRALECIAPIAPDHGLAAKCDTDGDRIVFYGGGRPVAADWMFLLLTEKLELEPVVYDLRFSRAVTERLEADGVAHVVSKVGRVFLAENMRTANAAFGAEMSGHYYFKEFGMEAPELVLLYVTRLVRDSGMTLGELIAPYIRYHKSDEISVPVKDRKYATQVIERLARDFHACQQYRTDGLTVDCWDTQGWWFNVRPSNTEPVLRAVVEAKEKDLLNEKVRRLRDCLT